jgi:gliding motility-associated-like protein
MRFRNILFIALLLICVKTYSQQQDVDFHLNAHLLNGQKILKVKRDFHDIYLWVLGQNNNVYRVNSVTLAIDDYSSQFAVYNNFQFVDIMGHSADTVFIGTNSTNVIELANGSFRVIGSSDGIPGTVNSLGIDLGWSLGPGTRNEMLIGTDQGVRTFNVQTQTIGVLPDGAFAGNSSIANSRIYESTYRNEIYKDSTAYDQSGWTTDTLQYLPVAFNPDGVDPLPGPFVVGYVWKGNHTFGSNVNTVFSFNLDLSTTVFASYFWGTENGMFQTGTNFSNNIVTDPWSQYLSGIKVNKITDIMGLTAFSSYYNSAIVKQNLLIGTDNGFYFSTTLNNPNGVYPAKFSLFHDAELGNTIINDICVNAVPDAHPICENGVWLGANDGLYLLKPDYAAFLNSTPIQAINFLNKPDTLSSLNVCTGDSVLAVVNSSLNGSYTIQWYENGNELPAQSKRALTIKTAGDYYAVLYDPCEDIHLPSNHLQVNIVNKPVFTFNYPDTIKQCNYTRVALQTTYNSGYHYQWYTNDVLNGDTTSSFIVTQTGKYKVEVSACTNSWVPSKEVQVNLIQLPTPVITTDKAAYCIGDNATLSVAISPDPSFTINWYMNNVLQTNNSNHTSLITNIPGNYTASVVNKTVNTDGTICSQVSAVLSLVFNLFPTVTIEKIVKTTLCEGQTVDLLAHHTGGTVKWSTGETTDQISVNTAGNYTAVVTSSAGCQADTSISITFLPNPILSVKDTTICTYKQKPVTLTAPPSYTKYTWNSLSGDQTYQVSLPQTVSLTVTDANGCEATQQIIITDKCPNIWIPNTFTPNGDGINDTWTIEGLDNDQSVLVRVYTRYGNMVFESKGYTTSWNGEYGGKKLPAGVYYYVLTSKKGTQKFSGSVTIIY